MRSGASLPFSSLDLQRPLENFDMVRTTSFCLCSSSLRSQSCCTRLFFCLPDTKCCFLESVCKQDL